MARDTRRRRDLPIDIDTKVLLKLAVEVGANHKQYRHAYSRALKRTRVTLQKRMMQDIKTGIAPRSLARMRRRMLSFMLRRGPALEELKIWFGMNAVKVKDLKGRIRGRTRPHHTRRDPKTGRYAPARRPGTPAGFEPRGKLLKGETFGNSEVGRTRQGRRTILVRDQVTRRTREAEISIYAGMMDYIEDNAFSDVVDIFMNHFRRDLKGRIRAKIDV